MARKHMDAVVSAVRPLTSKITEYELATVEGRPLPPYGPGAHIEVHTGTQETGPVIRHYSLIGSSSDGAEGRHTCRIAVQREDRGAGSAFIHAHFNVGTRLQISVPLNNFPLDYSDDHILLIAGGIGITPILSMARSLARRGQTFSILYAGRTAEDMAYHDNVAALNGAHVRLHYSGTNNTQALNLEEVLRSQPPGIRVYVCGPAGMVAAAHAAGSALDWSPDQIRSELFGAQRSANDQPFEVELRKSGRVVQVGKNTTILEALTAAKADVLWDCRRGECGLCPMDVLEADGPIEHRDHYLSADERAEGKSLCICVSRIRGTRLVLDA